MSGSIRHHLSPDRQRQLATCKLVWLFVGEQCNVWPDQINLGTELGRTLGIGAHEGHRFCRRFAEEFPGVNLNADQYFGPPPTRPWLAVIIGPVRRLIRLLHVVGIYPAPIGTLFATADLPPLTLTELCVAVLSVREIAQATAECQPPPLAADVARIPFALEHDLLHWAHHLPRFQPKRTIAGAISLLNRGRVYER